MHDTLAKIAADMLERTTGPLHFRMYLQPAAATVFAVLDGLKDARAGNPPYAWSLLTTRGHTAELLRTGWKSVGKIFVIAWLLDVVYQFKVQGFIHPGEAILVAIILAIVPYVILRGPVTRIASKTRSKS